MKDIEKLSIRDTPGGAVILVKVVPGSSRDRVVGVLGDSLKIATSAAPEKGKANAAVAKILADALGVDARRVELVSGPTNPRKEFRIVGASAQGVLEALEKI
jgi:hypothetical protein